MSRYLLLKYNNYDYSDENIEKVKQYLSKNNNWSNNLSESQIKHFKNQYRNFELRNNDIYYKPLNLKIVKKDDVKATLETEYNDFR